MNVNVNVNVNVNDSMSCPFFHLKAPCHVRLSDCQAEASPPVPPVAPEPKPNQEIPENVNEEASRYGDE